MGEARKARIEAIDLDLNAIYRGGGFEVKRAEALWAELEKLEADEAKEAVSK